MSETRNRGRIWFLATAFVAIAVIAFFAGRTTSPPEERAAGTVTGVEKAQKYRTEQMAAEDVTVGEEDIHALMQSREFQKLIEKEDFRLAVRMDDAWWPTSWFIWRGGW
ncbi:MAG: hypothetical protein GTO42_02740 [Candidatus Latescibacteria bacterium]|nr:hypothetical protein [Candidatus Latescibacterota bacterium]NIO01055.1 hypothetical protein [Candidatus Latescibacterota bacterium]NIO27454.1 hypothetical protein [Candidatus Latescibacterota bacterium]NIO54976.1 hypothetical protein [Candidatus Latescibacterota bacterium]NIT01065.1 hypothetical protein [Candidatus Latescibacterota bacterium]